VICRALYEASAVALGVPLGDIPALVSVAIEKLRHARA
jgi:hypothetical protein